MCPRFVALYRRNEVVQYSMLSGQFVRVVVKHKLSGPSGTTLAIDTRMHARPHLGTMYSAHVQQLKHPHVQSHTRMLTRTHTPRLFTHIHIGSHTRGIATHSDPSNNSFHG